MAVPVNVATAVREADQPYAEIYARGSTPRLPQKDLFFCGTPTEKASREGQRFRKTEVAESPIPSPTDVVADHAQRTNCILLHVGISTCLDVGACRIVMRMRLRWRNFDSP